MKNNNPPFVPGQGVVKAVPKFGYSCPGYSDETKKDETYTVDHCFIGKLTTGILTWGVVLVGLSGSYEAAGFAPIRETRIHKRIAVPEELLVVKEGDVLEPSKPKVVNQ